MTKLNDKKTSPSLTRENDNFSRQNPLKYFVMNYAVVLILVVIVIAVGVMEPKFMTLSNFQNILKQVSIVGIIACGSAFVIIGGMIDLSVGSIVSLVAVSYVMIYDVFGIGPSIVLCLLIGAGCGLASGSIISAVKGNMGVSFIVTYGMQSIIAAIALLVSGSTYKKGNLNDPIFMGIGYGIGPIAILIAAVVISQFLLVKTKPGRRMYFLGGNEEAARLTGVRTKSYRTLTFMLSGLFAALGAIVMVSRVGSASPTAGTGYELDVIAGIVVGGIALTGGKGSIVNAFIGTVAIGVLSNALNLLGVSSYPQLIVKGALIIIAVLIDTMTKNKDMQNTTYKAKLKKRTELG